MAHPAAPPLLLRVGDHEELTRLVRASSVRAGLAQRARIVLLASEGLRNAEIAERVGVSRPTVNVWRSRYVDAGMAGLVDVDRPGRPKTVDQRKIIAETLRPPPARLGVTHWSSRLLGEPAEAGPRHGVEGVAVVRGDAVAGGDVQVLHRSRAGRQGGRRHRVVSGAAGERDRVVCGREVPDPGVGPDPEDAADAARACRAAHP